MAHLKYAIGPWQWVENEEEGTFWKPPEGTRGLIDLRDIESQKLKGGFGSRPYGFFSVDPDSRLSSDYKVIGQGDLREITVSRDILDAWESFIGHRPIGNNIADLLWDQLTNGSGKSGEMRHIIPSVHGNIELWLGGHGLIRKEKFDVSKSPYKGKILESIQESFRKVFDSVSIGRTKANHHRRLLTVFLEKYNLPLDQWERFVPTDLIDATIGPMDHETSISENWNCSDASGNISCQLTWEATSGTWNLVSNQALLNDTVTRFNRANHDLSTFDHYSEATLVTGPVGGARWGGCCVRFSSSAETAYFIRRRTGANFFGPAKVVAGTVTLLGSETGQDRNFPERIRCEIDGSSLKTVVDDNEDTITDTSIEEGFRTGVGGESGSGVKVTFDDFEASDLDSGPTITSQARVGRRTGIGGGFGSRR